MVQIYNWRREGNHRPCCSGTVPLSGILERGEKVIFAFLVNVQSETLLEQVYQESEMSESHLPRKIPNLQRNCFL